MASKFKFETNGCKTYATEANADKAVAKAGFEHLRHFMMRDDAGRFFPVFVGGEAAMHEGVHFHFHVVG